MTRLKKKRRNVAKQVPPELMESRDISSGGSIIPHQPSQGLSPSDEVFPESTRTLSGPPLDTSSPDRPSISYVRLQAPTALHSSADGFGHPSTDDQDDEHDQGEDNNDAFDRNAAANNGDFAVNNGEFTFSMPSVSGASLTRSRVPVTGRALDVEKPEGYSLLHDREGDTSVGSGKPLESRYPISDNDRPVDDPDIHTTQRSEQTGVSIMQELGHSKISRLPSPAKHAEGLREGHRDPVSLPSITVNRSRTPAGRAPNSLPKKVGFTSYVTASRERTETEAWSFYWFETHCRECRQCRDPYAVYKRGDHLCSKGEILARDVAVHVYMREGEIYERVSSSPQDPDRVEIPHNYHYLQGQLKAIEKTERRAIRRSRRAIVDVDRLPHRRSDEGHREDQYYQNRHSEEKLRNAHYDHAHRPASVLQPNLQDSQSQPSNDPYYSSSAIHQEVPTTASSSSTRPCLDTNDVDLYPGNVYPTELSPSSSSEDLSLDGDSIKLFQPEQSPKEESNTSGKSTLIESRKVKQSSGEQSRSTNHGHWSGITRSEEGSSSAKKSGDATDATINFFAADEPENNELFCSSSSEDEDLDSDSDHASSGFTATVPSSVSGGALQHKPEHVFIKNYRPAIECAVDDDDACSLASDNDDINSTADSIEFSEPRTTAIKYIARTFLHDTQLDHLFREAHGRMGSEKFVRNHRRLLKTYYLRGLSSSQTRSERYALSILRSRRRRIELSNLIFQSFASESSQSVIELDQEVVDKLSLIDRFLASQKDYPGTLPDHDHDDEGVILDHLQDATDFMTTGLHFQAYRVALGNFIDTLPSFLEESQDGTIKTVPAGISSAQASPGQDQNSETVKLDPHEDGEYMPSPSSVHEHPDLYVSGVEADDRQFEDFDHDGHRREAKHSDEFEIPRCSAPPTDVVEDKLYQSVVEAETVQTCFVLTSRVLIAKPDSQLQFHDRYMRARMEDLLQELSSLPASKIEIDEHHRSGMLNRYKLLVESLVKAPLQWWPMSNPLPPLASGMQRVKWQCPCAERHFMDIPEPLAASMKLDLANAGAYAGGQQGCPKDLDFREASAASAQQPSSLPGDLTQLAMTGAPSEIAPSAHAPVHPNDPLSSATTISQGNNKNYHVFMLVKRLADYQMAQWQVDPQTDDAFFQSLRATYIEERGLLRYWLSIYRFSHCDFRRLLKTGDGEFEPGISEIPDTNKTESRDYRYAPNPIRYSPPVTKRVFYNRFHACYKPSRGHAFHKCRKLCNVTKNSVGKVPKRDKLLVKDGPGEEVFWGLYAREWASPWACLIWSVVLFLLPQLPFVIYWLIKHPGDLQDALAPWSICMAILSVFWASLWIELSRIANLEVTP